MVKKVKKRKTKRQARREIDFDQGAENFGEEMGNLGERVGKTIKTKRLYRSGKHRILGGVCGGIGEYLNVDPVIIRLLWVIATLALGFGVLAYIIAWIIIPRNPNHRW